MAEGFGCDYLRRPEQRRRRARHIKYALTIAKADYFSILDVDFLFEPAPDRAFSPTPTWPLCLDATDVRQPGHQSSRAAGDIRAAFHKLVQPGPRPLQRRLLRRAQRDLPKTLAVGDAPRDHRGLHQATAWAPGDFEPPGLLLLVSPVNLSIDWTTW